MRWTALLLLAMAMFCSYIFMDILSPIKDLMQETRGWDSTAFGTMQGSEVFLNVFVFFLIFAGIILDKMGVRFTAVLSAAVMLVGACVKWYAVSDSFIGSGLETWFNNNLNYIPGFDELGVSPFYLELGGKLFDDHHASRVLPGFKPDSKLRMFAQLRDQLEIVIVVSAEDIEKNKVRADLGITYDEDVLRLRDEFSQQ